jgi:hypothetical protein
MLLSKLHQAVYRKRLNILISSNGSFFFNKNIKTFNYFFNYLELKISKMMKLNQN